MASEQREQLEEERTLIRDGLLRNMKAGEVRFLIPESWYYQWRKYVGMGGYGHSRGDPSLHPGPFDLSPLVDQNGQLKRDLVEMQDYRVLPSDSWNILVQRYGVAPKSVPAIKRNVIIARNKANCNVEVVELYPLEITVIPLWDLTRALRATFSRITTLDKMDACLRKYFGISDEKTESRLWHRNQSSKEMELCDSSKLNDLTLQNMCLNNKNGLFLFETRTSPSDQWLSSSLDFVHSTSAAVDDDKSLDFHAKCQPEIYRQVSRVA